MVAMDVLGNSFVVKFGRLQRSVALTVRSAGRQPACCNAHDTGTPRVAYLLTE